LNYEQGLTQPFGWQGIKILEDVIKNTPLFHTPTPTPTPTPMLDSPTPMLDSPMLDLSGLFLILELELRARINELRF
jgi:hypothetical protein